MISLVLAAVIQSYNLWREAAIAIAVKFHQVNCAWTDHPNRDGPAARHGVSIADPLAGFARPINSQRAGVSSFILSAISVVAR